MTDLPQLHDDKFASMIAAFPADITSEEAVRASKVLETFSKTRPIDPEPEIPTHTVPTTRLGKIKAGIASAWDNETTRVALKAGLGFAGIAYVTHATVKKDHILEKQAIAIATTSQSR
jgi:hypothetical protein